MSAPFIRIERDGPVATLILDRPAVRNALTEAMGDAIEGAVDSLQAETDVRVLLVRGEGPAFCAGGDLGFIEQRIASGQDDNRRAMRRFYQRFLSLRALAVPVIAAMHGAAMGAGVCLALACDLRVAATGTRLGLNFVRLGLPPGMGATLLLPRLVGQAHAAELLLTGKTIDAEEALRIGLVSKVVPPDELLGAARALAEQVASAAPGAVAATVRALRQHAAEQLEAALDAEAHAQSIAYGSEDVVEGVRAARERRTAVFRGR